MNKTGSLICFSDVECYFNFEQWGELRPLKLYVTCPFEAKEKAGNNVLDNFKVEHEGLQLEQRVYFVSFT